MLKHSARKHRALARARVAAQGWAQGPKAWRAKPPYTAQFSPSSVATDSPERLNAAARAQSSGSRRRRGQAARRGARSRMSSPQTANDRPNPASAAKRAATQILVLGLHLLSWHQGPCSCGSCVWQLWQQLCVASHSGLHAS